MSITILATAIKIRHHGYQQRMNYRNLMGSFVGTMFPRPYIELLFNLQQFSHLYQSPPDYWENHF
jgi:hypothetical protein